MTPELGMAVIVIGVGVLITFMIVARVLGFKDALKTFLFGFIVVLMVVLLALLILYYIPL